MNDNAKKYDIIQKEKIKISYLPIINKVNKISSIFFTVSFRFKANI